MQAPSSLRAKGLDEKKLRAAAYCRVSTLDEAQEESYETQRDAYEKKIAADPQMELAGIYGDQGISGASADRRPEFQRMLKDCKEGRIDIVMTKSISRFARNLADCMESIRTLRELRIPVIFEREGINTMSDTGELLLSVLASIAQEEINNMSQNIRWSQDQHNATGNPVCKARYGYRKERTGQKHKWVIYEPEAVRVRFAFQKADEGWKYREIINGLDAIESREGIGVKWTYERVHAMLVSEVYIGDVLTNKHVKIDYLDKRTIVNHGQRPQYYLENHHEPIIDKAQFERVQERLKVRGLRSDIRMTSERRSQKKSQEDKENKT